jgi:peptide/nickel transport system substrate-binding protein
MNLNIRATEFASALNLADKGDYSAFLVNWSGRTDPDGNIYNFIACNVALNYPGYCNPEVDKELKAAREVEKPAERLAHYKKVAEQTLKDRPILYLGHQRWIYAFTAKLAGFEPYPDGLIRPQGLKMQ